MIMRLAHNVSFELETRFRLVSLTSCPEPEVVRALPSGFDS